MNAPDQHRPNPPGDSPTTPRRSRGQHIDHAFDRRIDLCDEMVAKPAAAQHVAHFSGTVRDFSCDLLSALAGDPLPRVESVRDRLCRLGQQMCLLFGSLDESLAEVRSGALIRLVVHAAHGACYADQIVPGQIAVGTRFERPVPDGPVAGRGGVREADVLMSDLVTAIRRLLRQGPENPGGFEPKPGVEHPAPDSFWVDRHDRSEMTSAFAKDAADAMTRSALHYVALCRDAEVLVAVDQLDNQELAGYFTQITVGARRAYYADFGRGLGFLAGRVGRMSRPVLDGPLHRVVFDVQQGALYYYRLSSDMYLLGVTLDQSEVETADDRMAELAAICARLVAN